MRSREGERTGTFLASVSAPRSSVEACGHRGEDQPQAGTIARRLIHRRETDLRSVSATRRNRSGLGGAPALKSIFGKAGIFSI